MTLEHVLGVMPIRRRKLNIHGMSAKDDGSKTCFSPSAVQVLGPGATQMNRRWCFPKAAYGLVRKTDWYSKELGWENYYFNIEVVFKWLIWGSSKETDCHCLK